MTKDQEKFKELKHIKLDLFPKLLLVYTFANLDITFPVIRLHDHCSNWIFLLNLETRNCYMHPYLYYNSTLNSLYHGILKKKKGRNWQLTIF